MESTATTRPASAPPSAPYGLPGCPNCGPVELHPVFDGEVTNFYCPLCGSCWHVELGFVARVPVETCPGCQIELICRERRGQAGKH
ncbi:MAG TPA: hypothetical protein VHL53_15845 [Acidimicrobiia bacterium]|nr:hypothetical protein [Acidimicrobiia bacterium]